MLKRLIRFEMLTALFMLLLTGGIAFGVGRARCSAAHD